MLFINQLENTCFLSDEVRSPSPSVGSSLEAAMTAFRGSFISFSPFLYTLSLSTVSKAFCIAGPAFHISSRKTTSAVGKYPSIILSYVSWSLSLLILTGPKISSGVENLLMRYSNPVLFLKAILSRLAIMLLPTPGNPKRNIDSPANELSSDRAIVSSRSNAPLHMVSSKLFILSLFMICCV